MIIPKPYEEMRNWYVEAGDSGAWSFEYEDQEGVKYLCDVSLENITDEQFTLNEGFIMGLAYETLVELKKEGLWGGEYAFDFEVPVVVCVTPI